MAYWNAVLLPPASFKNEVTSFVQQNYSGVSEGYCIGERVFPHITLCQFESESGACFLVEGLFFPKITQFSLREGNGRHDGFIWVQYDILKEDWLCMLQEKVMENLGDVKICSETGSSYKPHMTFCRVPQNKTKSIVPCPIFSNEKGWIFSIGQSDTNGQFLGGIR